MGKIRLHSWDNIRIRPVTNKGNARLKHKAAKFLKKERKVYRNSEFDTCVIHPNIMSVCVLEHSSLTQSLCCSGVITHTCRAAQPLSIRSTGTHLVSPSYAACCQVFLFQIVLLNSRKTLQQLPSDCLPVAIPICLTHQPCCYPGYRLSLLSKTTSFAFVPLGFCSLLKRLFGVFSVFFRHCVN